MKYRLAPRLAIWLTFWTLVLGVLAPVASAALQPANSGDWVQICTATGMKMVKAGQDSSSPDSQGGRGGCPFCQLTTPVIASLPAAPVLLASPPPAALPIPAQTVPVADRFRAGIQPARAPPLA